MFASVYEPNDNEYDIAGFSVGVVDKDKIIDNAGIKPGNVLIGLPSSGIHSNGYSLVRKVFNLNGNKDEEKLSNHIEDLATTIGEELLKPTKIYVKTLNKLTDKFNINAISHITGGGFIENIPRILNQNTKAIINKKTWNIPPIFELIKKLGNIEERDMFNTFNMGIGMILSVNENDVDSIIKSIQEEKEEAFIIGSIVEGEKEVQIC